MKGGFYIDLANLYHSVNKRHDLKIDYVKILKSLKDRYELTTLKTHAYGAQKKDEANNFISFLRSMSIVPHYKKIRMVSPTQSKANWDVGMTIDVIKHMNQYDIIFLGTGDGDFSDLVNYIQDAGITCVVIGCNISSELLLVAQECIELTEEMMFT